MSKRPSVYANQFYPGNVHLLRQNILNLMEKVPSLDVSKKVKAIIVPHGSYSYSGGIAAYAYKLLKNMDKGQKWKVLLMGPEHSLPFIGAASDIFQKWETPLGEVSTGDLHAEVDSEHISDIPRAGTVEHSLEVQLPFLQMCLENFVLYPLYIGSGEMKGLAEDLEKFFAQEDVIVVVSADLSHYFSYDIAMETDLKTSETIVNLDLDSFLEKGDVCGKSAIVTLLHLAKKAELKCKMLEYRNTGDTVGDKSRVIGYGAYALF